MYSLCSLYYLLSFWQLKPTTLRIDELHIKGILPLLFIFSFFTLYTPLPEKILQATVGLRIKFAFSIIVYPNRILYLQCYMTRITHISYWLIINFIRNIHLAPSSLGCVYIYVCMNVCVRARVCVGTCVGVCRCVCVGVCIYIYTHNFYINIL